MTADLRSILAIIVNAVHSRMPDSIKLGSVWTTSELDLIVADYFAMLADDLAGRSYFKAKHNSILVSRIGRTRGSVEYKYQNISAVLDKLGMPWIPGYKPAVHHQGAIAEAIGRYLSSEPEAADPPLTSGHFGAVSEIFVNPPDLRREEPIPNALLQLMRKFDPVLRDSRNRSLGKAGEEFVLEVERRRLAEIGRRDLSQKVRWVAQEDGDGAGFDVLSFAPSGRELLLEVKTTNGSARTPFYLTRREAIVASERPGDWSIYRVHLFAKTPRIFTISPPLDKSIRLQPEIWRASF